MLTYMFFSLLMLAAVVQIINGHHCDIPDRERHKLLSDMEAIRKQNVFM